MVITSDSLKIQKVQLGSDYRSEQYLASWLSTQPPMWSDSSPSTRSIARGIFLCVLSPCVWSFQVNTKLLPSNLGAKSNTLRPRFAQGSTGASRTSSLHVSAVVDADTETVSLDWSFLDAVYLITCPNADPGSERLTKTLKILEETNLLDKVVIKEFDTDDEDRIRGCYASHLSVMRDALKEAEQKKGSGKNTWFQSFLPRDSAAANDDDGRHYKVLILEDNLDTSGSLGQSTIDGVVNYVGGDRPWDVVQLGYNPYVPNLVVTRTDHDRIVKLTCGVGSALGTTAYVINEQGMKTVIRQDDERGFYAPIPDVMAELFPESRFAAYPAPFVRAPKTKSLVNPQLDDLRALLFIPAVACQVQNVLTFSGLSTNALLPITIVLLLLSTVFSGRASLDALWSLATTGSFDGPILLALLSTCFTVLSLGILAQGALLAPKPPPAQEE